ncbi:hypothetical protein M8542_14455 [Amycolatopsis sp. OK19-0408]|uniref:Uncharacterized protein n=1 Tax=Amycolatopsis iheyensis TaxID=2945988 RepID=A0A9X2NBG0_9PSEU|nr:hypothetical protein [Amycolatopsis iheyensis]MCR6484022.1 hypothetical protein [Amycolatopsis iheyensis]
MADAAMTIAREMRHLSWKPGGVKRLRAAIHRTDSSMRILADELEPPS